MIECWLTLFQKSETRYRGGIDGLDFDSLAHRNEVFSNAQENQAQFVGIWEHYVRLLRDQAMKEHLLIPKQLKRYPSTLLET